MIVERIWFFLGFRVWALAACSRSLKLRFPSFHRQTFILRLFGRKADAVQIRY